MSFVQTTEVHRNIKNNVNDSFISSNSCYVNQPIVDKFQRDQLWTEILYRPYGINHNNVEDYFNNLSKDQKIDHDIGLIKKLSSIQNKHFNQRISINISPLSLSNQRFLKILGNSLINNTIDYSKICLEIVESEAFCRIPKDCFNIIKQIRKKMGWIALDDFGSGYAHWELLKLNCIDVIKVVNSNITKKPICNSYLKGIAKLAKCQNIKTVIEGVETHKDYITGLNLGYENFQGYLYNQ